MEKGDLFKLVKNKDLLNETKQALVNRGITRIPIFFSKESFREINPLDFTEEESEGRIVEVLQDGYRVEFEGRSGIIYRVEKEDIIKAN